MPIKLITSLCNWPTPRIQRKLKITGTKKSTEKKYLLGERKQIDYIYLSDRALCMESIKFSLRTFLYKKLVAEPLKLNSNGQMFRQLCFVCFGKTIPEITFSGLSRFQVCLNVYATQMESFWDSRPKNVCKTHVFVQGHRERRQASEYSTTSSDFQRNPCPNKRHQSFLRHNTSDRPDTDIHRGGLQLESQRSVVKVLQQNWRPVRYVGVRGCSKSYDF